MGSGIDHLVVLKEAPKRNQNVTFFTVFLLGASLILNPMRNNNILKNIFPSIEGGECCRWCQSEALSRRKRE